uniref:Filamin binding LIM protein 1 n=1 Tax=Latimeria chalumnae TaxID=7897 RepID=H2ZYB9_LATCH
MSKMPQKRMVSSLHITLTPPRRAVPVKQEAARETLKSSPTALTQTKTLSPKSNRNDYCLGKQHRGMAETTGQVSSSTGFLNGDFPPPPPLPLDEFPGTSVLDLPPPPPVPAVEESCKMVVDPVNTGIQKLNLESPQPLQSLPRKSLGTEERPPHKPNPTQNGHQETQPSTGKPNHLFFSSDICGFCHKVITLTDPAIEAMNKIYHGDCFTCRKCHYRLVGQLYYNKDGQPLCETCYKNTLEKCTSCKKEIEERIVRAMGNAYHPSCFTCVVCHKLIGDEQFALNEKNEIHCKEDFYRKYAPVCSMCQKAIIPKDDEDTYSIECLGKNFHVNCYICEQCGVSLSPEPTDKGCYPLDNRILCMTCHIALNSGSVS